MRPVSSLRPKLLPMRVLALEPFYAGSHRSFLDGWRAHSAHDWTVLSLPGRKWKWRMRHAAVTFAEDLAGRIKAGEMWDVVFCSSMLNLAEFRGLAPSSVANLPTVVYFHENQFTYPNRFEQERDLHFGFINLTSALSADAVWFNSAYHWRDFLAGARMATRKMPDYRLDAYLPQIEAKSAVQAPGVSPPAKYQFSSQGPSHSAPLHVVWAARWEHDKQPEVFFDALRELRRRGHTFRISVVGEQYAEVPAVFAQAHEEFGDWIVHWGYQPTRDAYEDVLAEADIAISTAAHEFFGLAAVETLLAGCWPLWPDRLTYPELLDVGAHPEHARHLYAGEVADLVHAWAEIDAQFQQTGHRPTPSEQVLASGRRFEWASRAPALDAGLEQLFHASRQFGFQPF